jgi:hypothetical protein
MRFSLPPLPLAGLPEPLKVHMDFDAMTVDEILQRLTLLRGPDGTAAAAAVGLEREIGSRWRHLSAPEPLGVVSTRY